jgi:hypothetical protein
VSILVNLGLTIGGAATIARDGLRTPVTELADRSS